MVKCPLCGFSFELDNAEALCRQCAMTRACPWVCCPNCGYSLSPEGGERRTGAPAASPRLSGLKAGQRAVIEDIDPALKPDQLKVLAALALLPGVEIVLVRRFPSLLVRAGERQIAMDRALARGILVRLPPSSPPSTG
ncbi:MAG: FeoA family protein [Candidatus Coatesbacteria bacterium]